MDLVTVLSFPRCVDWGRKRGYYPARPEGESEYSNKPKSISTHLYIIISTECNNAA